MSHIISNAYVERELTPCLEGRFCMIYTATWNPR